MQLTVTQTLKEPPEEVLAFLREAAAPIFAASAFKSGDAIAITPYPAMPAQWCLGLVGIVLMHNPDRQQVWVMAVDSGGGAMTVALPESACAPL